jgi:hypothetical protein
MTECGQRSIRDLEVALSHELAMPDVEANDRNQDGRKGKEKDQHRHPQKDREYVCHRN